MPNQELKEAILESGLEKTLAAIIELLAEGSLYPQLLADTRSLLATGTHNFLMIIKGDLFCQEIGEGDE